MLGEIDYFVSEEAVFLAVLEVAFFVVAAFFAVVEVAFFAVVEAVFFVVVAFFVVAAALRVVEAFAAGASEVASVFGSFRFFQRHHSKCRMNQHSQPSPFCRGYAPTALSNNRPRLTSSVGHHRA